MNKIYKTPDNYKVNHLQFCKNFSPVSVYILGLLWSDGYVHNVEQKNHAQVVFISTEPDSDYFSVMLKKTGAWGTYYYKDKKNPTWKTRFTAATQNPYLADFLRENDYTSKSTNSADKILEKIPKDFHRFFFLGVVDGDGCFSMTPTKKGYYHRRFSVASSLEQNWKYFSDLLNDIGVKFKIEKHIGKRGSFSKIHILAVDEIEKLGKYLYKSIDTDKIGLPRKYNVFNQICTTGRRKTSKYKQVCKVGYRWRAYRSQSGGKKFKWASKSYSTEEEAAKAIGTFI